MVSRSAPPSQFADDAHSTVSAPPSSVLKGPSTHTQVDWELLDSELRCMLSPVSDMINSNSISTSDAANSFSTIVHTHLHNARLISNCIYSNCHHIHHHDNQLIKLSKKLAVAKNNARRCIRLETQTFLNSVRMHNKIVKLSRKSSQESSTRRQEKGFRNNPWQFAKSACTDSEDASSPTFTSSDACQYFSDSFSKTHSTNQSLPSWIYDSMPSPTATEEFDDSPVTPGVIKALLKKCPSVSSPGVDGISYSFLKRLPSCHHFLATLFSKILLESNEAPPIWCSGKMILIHKKGDSSSPANFRPIALTSVIGKLLHKIIARRLERYCLANDILDPSIQKGFLRGINGTMEHIFAVTSIIEHAKSNGMPVSMSFLDLRNAFGSVSHQLIHDILFHIKVPTSIRSYVASVYSQLNAFVSTKLWSTSSFNITRGVFQGDTMSPIIFLLSFNPIIQLAQRLQCPGFIFKLPIADSESLPGPGSSIYVEWNEESSDEVPGWYKCSVSSYSSVGSANLLYSNQTTELVDLRSINWKHARKTSKQFRPISSPPPSFTPSQTILTPKTYDSMEHKVKAFADDLTIISANMSVHQQVLSKIDSCCLDLDLHLRPDKCITLSFTGKRFDKNESSC